MVDPRPQTSIRGARKKKTRKANRGKIELIGDILSICAKDGPVRQTHIMYKANLSYEALRMYIDELTKNNLIRNTPEGLYLATSEGEEVARCYLQIRKLLNQTFCTGQDLDSEFELLSARIHKLLSLGMKKEFLKSVKLSSEGADNLIKGMEYLIHVYNDKNINLLHQQGTAII